MCPRVGAHDPEQQCSTLTEICNRSPGAASMGDGGPHAEVVPARLPVLARKVTWDEVETKVFRNVCWHCHAEPDFSAGSLGDTGERRSIFAPLPDGTPRLVAHLDARHDEERGGTLPGIRGMPLGLPALPLVDIQLVESWIQLADAVIEATCEHWGHPGSARRQGN